MEHKEQIALYLSGLADTKTEHRTENALLTDTGFLESFIEAVELRLCAAPYGFAGAVMSMLPSAPAAAVTILSRRLGAAVCFCSAAAIILLTLSGFDRHIIEFISAQSGKFNELIALIQKLTSGGYI